MDRKDINDILRQDVDSFPSLTEEGRNRLIRRRKRIFERAPIVDALSQDVLSDLKQLGYDIEGVDEIGERFHRVMPPNVVDVLIAHINRNMNRCLACDESSGESSFFHSLVSALASTKSPFNGDFLTKCYDQTHDLQVRFTILSLISMEIVTGIESWLSRKARDPDDPLFCKTLNDLRN